MAFASFKLENLPRRVQFIIIAVLSVALVAVVYMVFLRPLLEERSAIRKEIAQLEAAVAQATAVESQLEQFKREVTALDARLVELRRILPSQKETPDVLRNVQRMASESHLLIVKFVPQPVAPRGFYVDWPIRMELEGSYNALGAFFEKIGRFTRIVNIENIGVKGIEGSTDPSRTLQSTCTATTFVFEDAAGRNPDEIMSPTAGKAPDKGKAPGQGTALHRGSVPVN